MIDRILRTLEIGTTALWTGASAGFAFVSAPAAFGIVEDRDAFARLTAASLARLARLTYVAAGVAVATAVAQRAYGRAAAGAVAIAAVAYHERAIVPAMTAAQAAMGSFRDVALDDPRRVAYAASHTTSTRVFGTALLAGVGQLVLAAVDR